MRSGHRLLALWFVVALIAALGVVQGSAATSLGVGEDTLTPTQVTITIKPPAPPSSGGEGIGTGGGGPLLGDPDDIIEGNRAMSNSAGATTVGGTSSRAHMGEAVFMRLGGVLLWLQILRF